MEVTKTLIVNDGSSYYYVKDIDALLKYCDDAKFREVDDDELKDKFKAQLQK